MRGPRSIPVLLLLLAALPLAARVRMDVQPREFTLDETATLSLTIQGGIPGTPQLNLPEGLEISSSGRNEDILQGRRETTFRYTLRATAPGDYIIGPYSLNLDGRSYALDGIPVTAKPARVVQRTDDLFMQFESASPRGLVQQPVTLTVTFFSLNQIDENNIERIGGFPDGLELSQWQRVHARDQMIDGRRYFVHRYEARVTPLTQGTYILNPVFLVPVLEADEEITRGAMGMFTRRMTRRNIRLQPDAILLEARNPPTENRPADFAGAVGQFSLNVSASPVQVRVGEPITLRVQLNGRGNIRSLLPPSLEESDDFRVFSARLVEEDLREHGRSGRKTIEQVIIPKHAEVDRIPGLRFSYFNPESWEYVTRSTEPLRLDVSPAEVVETGVFAGPGTLRLNLGPSLLGQDLVYLKIRPERLRPFPQAPGAAMAVWSGLPVLLWALGSVLLARQDKLRNDPALARQLQAPQRLRKHLAALRDADAARLYETIWTALAQYLGHRFRLPPGEVDTDRVREHLAGTFSEERLTGLEDWLRRCERARYAGAPSEQDAAETAKSFEAFMLSLDREGK